MNPTMDPTMDTTVYPTMDPTTDSYNNSSTLASTIIPSQSSIPLSRILLFVFLVVCVIVTMLGNLVVILAFAKDRKLTANTFSYYIINLAVTDFLVASTAMSFYSIDVLLGYWPFGGFMCGLWIASDYGMTFASVFTLVAISLDRFYSVTWSIHYRKHNTKRKAKVVIAIIWVSMVILWIPPCIMDRLENSIPYVCIWEPSNHPAYVIFIAVVGHHGPCVILLLCYVKLTAVMICRVRRKPRKPHLTVNEQTATQTAHQSTGEASMEINSSVSVTTASGQGNSSKPPAPKRIKVKDSSEWKIFMTMSVIIISYFICWVPFHVVFDLSAFAQDLVPNTCFAITFWMTYLNSLLNPILYAFSNKDLRVAFTKVMLCKR